MKYKAIISFLLFISLSRAGLEDDCEQYVYNKKTLLFESKTSLNIKFMMTRAEKGKVYNSNDDTEFLFRNDVPTKTRYLFMKMPHDKYTKGYLLNMMKLNSRMMGFHYLTCQYDVGYVYIAKYRIDLEDLCENLNAEPEVSKNPVIYNTLVEKIDSDRYIQHTEIGSILELPEKFESNSGLLGKGAYGEVKTFKINKSPESQKVLPDQDDIAVKRIAYDRLDMRELYVILKSASLKYGTKFYGCVYNSKHLFMIQERLASPLDKAEFHRKYLKMSLTERVDFIAALAEGLYEFAEMGFVHNDIKPGNIMVDKDFVPHLIDFGFAVPENGPDSPGLTEGFASPTRYQADIALPQHDVYSLAVSILAIESVKNDDVLYYEFGMAKTKMREQCRKKDRPPECLHYLTATILGVLANNWGYYDENINDVQKMNLTTLILKIIVYDHQITPKAFYNQITRIRNSLHASNVQAKSANIVCQPMKPVSPTKQVI